MVNICWRLRRPENTMNDKVYIALNHDREVIGLVLAIDKTHAEAYFFGAYGVVHQVEEIDPAVARNEIYPVMPILTGRQVATTGRKIWVLKRGGK